MKRKAVCLLLCALMALPFVFSGCSKEATVTIEDYSNAVTLTLYGIKGEGTTEEAIQRVEDAMNVVSEYEFKVHLDLRLYPEDEYAEILENKIKKIASETSDENDSEAEKGYIDEDGVFHYPEAGEDQLDIFLVTDLDSFNRYYTDYDIFCPLDGELDSDSYLIKKYVNPTLLNSFKINDVSYAIPNNHVVGTYQFMLLNKGIMDDLYYSKDDVTTISQLTDYISDVYDQANLGMTGTKIVVDENGKKSTENFNYSDYANVVDTFGMNPLATYLVNDEQSVIGANLTREPAADTVAMPRNLLTFSKYKNDYVNLYNMKLSGVIKDISYEDIDLNTAKVAAALVEGTSELAGLYAENYYVSVYRYPMATNEEVYSSAYAVCNQTKNVSACMDIIRYLSTDTEFRNIYQYGVEGTDFEVDDDDDMLVHILSDDYNMNPIYTGNQFIMYQNDKMTDDEIYLSNDYWKRGKSQNNHMIADPYLGFSAKTTADTISLYDDYEAGENSLPVLPYSIDELYAELTALSDAALAKLKNPTEHYAEYKVDSLSGLVDAIGAELSENEYVKAATSKTYKDSPFTLYVTWHKRLHPTETTTTG